MLWQAAPGCFLLEVPQVGRYLVEGGRRILIQPAPEAGAQQVQRFLHMAPLAALLYQRGALALHAAAASQGQGVVLLAGDSGAGKSTLLAALLQRGWQLLADELAALDLAEDGRLVVFPTSPEVRLWPDAAGQLGLQPASPSSAGVYAFPGQLAPAPLPLRAICWLSIHNRDEISLGEVTGAELFRAVGQLTYHSHIADALLDRTAYFRRAAIIAASIPVYRLRRPRGRWCLPALADRVVEVTRLCQ